jgi:hypothetical protein
MSAAEVSDLIDRTDARIDLVTDSGSLPALILEDLSATWTALRVMLKDPNARGLGEYSERREITMKMLKDEIKEIIALAGGGIAFTPAVETLG